MCVGGGRRKRQRETIITSFKKLLRGQNPHQKRLTSVWYLWNSSVLISEMVKMKYRSPVCKSQLFDHTSSSRVSQWPYSPPWRARDMAVLIRQANPVMPHPRSKPALAVGHSHAGSLFFEAVTWVKLRSMPKSPELKNVFWRAELGADRLLCVGVGLLLSVESLLWNSSDNKQH